MKPRLLVKIDREGYIEKLHYGFVWLIDEVFNIILKEGDDANAAFPFRSGAKPLQAAAVIDSGAFEYFGFSHKELAAICASHTGEDVHVQTVNGILEKIGLSENDLRCQPKTLKNNCSGKHAGMLAVCVKNNWDIADYLNVNHPLQIHIMRNIKELCRLHSIPQTVKDGCTAPVPVLPHYNMGVGYLNLMFNEKYRDIRLAMTENPYIVGGEGRIDTEVMGIAPGRFVSKVAAEGVCIVVNLEKKQVLIVRITDADRNARTIEVRKRLKQLSWDK